MENKKKYKLIIFDFDGTLADSFPWFVKSLDAIADKFHLPRIEPNYIEELRSLNAANFLKYLHIPLYKLPAISVHMRNLMREEINEIKLFAGVEKMLHDLKAKNCRIAIVSTNSRENIARLLGNELLKLTDYFVGGVSLFGKENKLLKVLKMSGMTLEESIYIGDEMRDIQAAKKIRMPCAAVAWGFNTAAALAALHPDEMFYEVEEIGKIL